MCSAPLGRLVVIAVQGGNKDPELDIRLVMMKRLTITGSTMRPRTRELRKGGLRRSLLAKVWPALDQGSLRAGDPRRVSAGAEAADAHRLMESSTHIGKIVLTTSG